MNFILGYIIGFVVIVAIGTLLLLWAWNVFMPDVFGLTTIDIWQALALSILLSSIGRPRG